MSTITTEPTNSTPGNVERHVAFKFRLDPNQEQLIALARDGGASRFAYNMLVGYNAEVMRTRNEYWAKRHEEGATDDEIKAELKALTKKNSKFKTLGYMAFGKMLTAEVARHRACAKAIEEGPPSKMCGALMSVPRSRGSILRSAVYFRPAPSRLIRHSRISLILALVSVLVARWVRLSLRAARQTATRLLSLLQKLWAATEPHTYAVSLPTSAPRQT